MINLGAIESPLYLPCSSRISPLYLLCQVINLEAIESVSVNKGAEELKDRVRLLEAQQQR